MADISKITLPSGSVYNIKDTWARDQIATITGTAALAFRGVSSTPLTDNGTERPTVGGTAVELTDLGTGDIYFYGSSEYIWGPDDKWHELGNLTNLGGLAYKNTASADYTPAGGITINMTTSGNSYGIKTTTGTVNYTPAGSITNTSFSGTTTNISMNTTYQPAGGIAFTTVNKELEINVAANTTGNYQPAGTISYTSANPKITVSAAANTTGNYKPEGTISYANNNPGITVTATANTNGNYQPKGNVGAPTINVSTAGATTTITNPVGKVMAQELVTAVPSATTSLEHGITYYSVSSENLSLYQIGYTTANSISGTTVTVKTGDASYTATAPTFTGTTAQISASITMPAATFSGTTAQIGASITMPGATFTGTTVQLSNESFALPTTASFTGTTATISMGTSYTPEGSVSASFSGTGVRLVTDTIATPTTITGTFIGTPTTIEVS